MHSHKHACGNASSSKQVPSTRAPDGAASVVWGPGRTEPRAVLRCMGPSPCGM
eukprot:gene7767-biopygen21077